MTGLSGLFFGTRGERSVKLYDKVCENISHIQTLSASIMSLLDDIPENVKQDLEIGFISSFSVKGECVDMNISGNGKAVFSAIKNLTDSVEREFKK